MNENDLSYCELRQKEVVNATDGTRMGRITDILFSRDDGTVSGIVVPLARKGVFGKNRDVFIPWRCVQKIGEDVILVQLTVETDGSLSCGKLPPPPPPPPPCGPRGGRERHGKESGGKHEAAPAHPECDNRCEKCMLFDCAYRWAQMN